MTLLILKSLTGLWKKAGKASVPGCMSTRLRAIRSRSFGLSLLPRTVKAERTVYGRPANGSNIPAAGPRHPHRDTGGEAEVSLADNPDPQRVDADLDRWCERVFDEWTPGRNRGRCRRLWSRGGGGRWRTRFRRRLRRRARSFGRRGFRPRRRYGVGIGLTA